MRYGGTRFHIVLRGIGYSVVLFIYFILQDSVFSNLDIFRIKPLLMPVCCAAIALSEGMERGGAFGIAAGVLCDVSMGNPPIGFTVLLTLLGLGIGWLSDSLIGRNFITLLLCTLASLLVCAFFQILNLWMFKDVPLSALLRTVAAQTAFSLLFAVPLAGMVHRSRARGA